MAQDELIRFCDWSGSEPGYRINFSNMDRGRFQTVDRITQKVVDECSWNFCRVRPRDKEQSTTFCWPCSDRCTVRRPSIMSSCYRGLIICCYWSQDLEESPWRHHLAPSLSVFRHKLKTRMFERFYPDIVRWYSGSCVGLW